MANDCQIVIAGIDRFDVAKAIEKVVATYERRAQDLPKGPKNAVRRDNLMGRAVRLSKTAKELLEPGDG